MTPQLRQKLEAMAERGTPPEQEIARTKLEAMGPPPPPPLTAVAAGAPLPYGYSYSSNSSGTGYYFYATKVGT